MAGEIGVIGSAGDLGSQLVGWMRASGIEPITYDPKDRQCSTAAEVVANSRIVHWCAPLISLEESRPLPWATGAQVVLHNSVMRGSLDTARKYYMLCERRGSRRPDTSIVHAIMNEQNAVAVAEGHCSTSVKEHLEEIGLSTIKISVEEHDVISAFGQGLMAVLCKRALPRLESAPEDLLVPSSERLVAALTDNTAHWTATTYDVLCHNPELPAALRDMAAYVEELQASQHLRV